MLAFFGVMVFFVISGFLITTLLISDIETSGRISLKAFFRKRFVRILPAAGFYVAVVLALGHPKPLQAVYALTFTTSYAFGKAYIPLQHLWSLSVEEQFYLLWPLAFLGGLRSARFCCWAVILFAPICRLILVRHDVFHLFPCVSDGLAWGCLLAFYYNPLKNHLLKLFSGGRVLSTLAYAALCLLTPFMGWFVYENRLVTLWGLVPALISIVTLVAIERRDYILNWRPLSWIGLLSYSLYLWQQPFIALNEGPLNTVWARNFMCLAAACFSYYLVEQPALKLFQPKSRKPIGQNSRREVSAENMPQPIADPR